MTCFAGLTLHLLFEKKLSIFLNKWNWIFSD